MYYVMPRDQITMRASLVCEFNIHCFFGMFQLRPRQSNGKVQISR